jgi:hypothetical protein
VVVPDDEPVAVVVAELLRLLDEGGAGRPMVLVTAVGEQLDQTATLADQDVAQGAVVRLVRIDQVPAPPEVADVSDVAADSLTVRPDRWRPGWTIAAVAMVVAAAGWVGGVNLSAAAEPVAVAGVSAGLVLLGALLGAVRRAEAAVVTGAGALGAALAATVAWTADAGSGPVQGLLVTVVCLVVAVIAAGSRRAGLAAGAALGGLLAGAWSGLAQVVEPGLVAGIVAVVGVLVLGILPGIAMTVSGLNRLDGESLAGRGTDRRVAQDAVGAAHHLLTAASVAVSVVVAAAGLVLVARPGWSTGLGAAVAVTVACRARLAPLVPARWAMLTAALVVAVGWSSGATAGAPAVVAVALAVVGVGVVGAVWPPPPYVLARLRRLVDALELVAVLVLVPLLLASAGVFSDLLATW